MFGVVGGGGNSNDGGGGSVCICVRAVCMQGIEGKLSMSIRQVSFLQRGYGSRCLV